MLWTFIYTFFTVSAAVRTSNDGLIVLVINALRAYVYAKKASC